MKLQLTPGKIKPCRPCVDCRDMKIARIDSETIYPVVEAETNPKT